MKAVAGKMELTGLTPDFSELLACFTQLLLTQNRSVDLIKVDAFYSTLLFG